MISNLFKKTIIKLYILNVNIQEIMVSLFVMVIQKGGGWCMTDTPCQMGLWGLLDPGGLAKWSPILHLAVDQAGFALGRSPPKIIYLFYYYLGWEGYIKIIK